MLDITVGSPTAQVSDEVAPHLQRAARMMQLVLESRTHRRLEEEKSIKKAATERAALALEAERKERLQRRLDVAFGLDAFEPGSQSTGAADQSRPDAPPPPDYIPQVDRILDCAYLIANDLDASAEQWTKLGCNCRSLLKQIESRVTSLEHGGPKASELRDVAPDTEVRGRNGEAAEDLIELHDELLKSSNAFEGRTRLDAIAAMDRVARYLTHLGPAGADE